MIYKLKIISLEVLLYEKKKIVFAAISTTGVGGCVLTVSTIIKHCKPFFNDMNITYKALVFISILIFILLALVFFVKPIILTTIRWGIYMIMHKEELDSNAEPNKKTPTRKNLNNLSKSLFKELESEDSDSEKDFDKIQKIIDYKGK